MDLAQRRERVIAEHKAMEKYDPHWKAEAEKGRKLSEQPLALLCDDEIVLLGECVGKVLDGLRAYVEKDAATWNDPQVQNARQHDYRIFVTCKKIAEKYPTPPVELRMGQQTWNRLTYGLVQVGIIAALADGTFGN